MNGSTPPGNTPPADAAPANTTPGNAAPADVAPGSTAPGSYLPNTDFWGTPEALLSRLPSPWAVVVDERVLRLHPRLRPLLGAACLPPVEVRAGEAAKSLACFERLAAKLQGLARGSTVLALGGGTIGDLCTVLAHTLKRGMRLWHWPTTLLAAVDSSVGGKGALNLKGVKNALGAFHYPEGGLLCPALFETLTVAQRQEGRCEAWKMATCLNQGHFEAWAKVLPGEEELIYQSREMKARICEADPYESSGHRAVLNFGHSFGHVIESISHYRIRHGQAVGLGLWCALDIGRCLGVTPSVVAQEIEEVWQRAGLPSRAALAKALSVAGDAEVEALLRADKKNRSSRLRMVLLKALGEVALCEVATAEWVPLAACWRKGEKP
ncbi:MAG: 3-dehydroquinate synthase [Cystobacterineae bacterium]|nr:3-dehydroquinate synthase [Cystobacterineae bacterium]